MPGKSVEKSVPVDGVSGWKGSNEEDEKRGEAYLR